MLAGLRHLSVVKYWPLEPAARSTFCLLEEAHFLKTLELSYELPNWNWNVDNIVEESRKLIANVHQSYKRRASKCSAFDTLQIAYHCEEQHFNRHFTLVGGCKRCIKSRCAPGEDLVCLQCIAAAQMEVDIRIYRLRSKVDEVGLYESRWANTVTHGGCMKQLGYKISCGRWRVGITSTASTQLWSTVVGYSSTLCVPGTKTDKRQ